MSDIWPIYCFIHYIHSSLSINTCIYSYIRGVRTFRVYVDRSSKNDTNINVYSVIIIYMVYLIYRYGMYNVLLCIIHGAHGKVV